MITIATCRNLMMAELARTRLESHGIAATIPDANSYSLGYGSVMGGVRLQVPSADAGRAGEILAGAEYGDPANDGGGFAEPGAAGDLNAPAAGAESRRPAGWPVALLFVVGLLFLILGRPAGNWRAINPYSGQLVLFGEMLILAGLWISYGRLSAAGENEIPPE